ncbi:MAG: hypothetical protein GC145_16775 [Caulobacter sp.]|nr:hypothetical protein [Caulobacter sp.]
MPRLSVTFFTTAVLMGLAGMVWGSIMGASGDHAMMPAHAHLNLLGWVSLSIMGGFYALPGVRFSPLMAWINYGLSTFGVLAMAIMLPQVLTGKLPGHLMPVAELPLIAGMLVFALVVLGNWRKPA